MYNIVAIIGKAGSGKDTILQTVLRDEPALHEIISCTSRPKRQGEEHGVNYFYYSDQDFLNKIKNGEMLESTNFNNWYYGTGYDSVLENKINIGVFNPAGIRSLLNRKDCNVLVFWVRAADKTRLIRQLNREANPNVEEIIRRFSTDEQDFSNIDFDYISLENEDYFDDIACAKTILVQLQTHFAQGQK